MPTLEPASVRLLIGGGPEQAILQHGTAIAEAELRYQEQHRAHFPRSATILITLRVCHALDHSSSIGYLALWLIAGLYPPTGETGTRITFVDEMGERTAWCHATHVRIEEVS